VARLKVCANLQVFVPVRAAVEAPPAPSPCSLNESEGQRSGNWQRTKKKES